MPATVDSASPIPPQTKGRVLHSAIAYDLIAWLFTRGREPAFRQRLVTLARIGREEVVLDIGCGTGTLAIAARHAVGPMGSVVGVDASREMVARAERKARRAGVEVGFRHGVVEALPVTGASVDVVLSTLMMHHLAGPARRACIREVLRVLRPGGRLFVADFTEPDRQRGSLFSHFHRHGHVDPAVLAGLVRDSGFTIRESGLVGIGDLGYVLATAGADT